MWVEINKNMSSTRTYLSVLLWWRMERVHLAWGWSGFNMLRVKMCVHHYTYVNLQHHRRRARGIVSWAWRFDTRDEELVCVCIYFMFKCNITFSDCYFLLIIKTRGFFLFFLGMFSNNLRMFDLAVFCLHNSRHFYRHFF